MLAISPNGRPLGLCIVGSICPHVLSSPRTLLKYSLTLGSRAESSGRFPAAFASAAQAPRARAASPSAHALLRLRGAGGTERR